MKKSKIIAPALGVLILSTAAAVTGTVAWFTASRVKEVSMSGITAVNPEQGLILTNALATNGSQVTITDESTEGTHYNSSNGDVSEGAEINIAHPYYRDASVDVNAGAVYGSVIDDDGELTGVAAKSFGTPDTKKYEGHDIYFASSFTLTFRISREESSYEQHLLLDEGKSSVDADDDAAGNASIRKAFRVGFKTASDWFVWAPYTSDSQGSTAGSSLRYVSGTTNAGIEANTTFYSAAQIITGNGASGATAYSTDSKDTPHATVIGYAGYLGLLHENSDLVVTVYTWFEGTDSACNNDATSLATSFAANLQFCMRKSALAS